MVRKKNILIETSKVLSRLSKSGWQEVFNQHGLDICADDLSKELLRPLDSINRDAPGFEDFAVTGKRGIEPGKPARSLLFHGLASPNVTSYRRGGKSHKIKKYPTPADLELMENFVYGLKPFSLEDIRKSAEGASLSIVVYAKEYRPAINTVHQKHADMCYSRTGISRVGTSEAKYLEKARGYMPEDKSSGKKIRVLPCRYAAYIAALVNGKEYEHGPMRFITNNHNYNQNETNQDIDKTAGISVINNEEVNRKRSVTDMDRKFWVPVHKLFSGKECLIGQDIDIQLTAKHFNEKIRRIHLMFGKLGHDGGWHEPDLSNSPFVFTEGIAHFASEDDVGPGLLMPVAHKSLVSIATYKKPGTKKSKILTFNVPVSDQIGSSVFSSSINLPANSGGARFGPEYVHARFAVDYEGAKEKDLNELENVAGIVSKGGYRAKHILDYTGDGWIEAHCPSLNMEVPKKLAAYSVVTPPDYFVKVKQSGLMQWWEQSAPSSIKKTIWPQNPGLPETLADQRIAANIELKEAGFNGRDDTMTAIVGQLNVQGGTGGRIPPQHNYRNSMLTDGASGVFAPGWDVSIDQSIDPSGEDEAVVTFFSTHGLGSPFPEDAKLCAALSSYWPAAAPDVTRTFQPSKRYATATPLLDSTIGQNGSEPWDGSYGPKIIDEEKRIIEYSNLDYSDYVKGALNNIFNHSEIGKIDHKDYLARTVVMARVYQSLNAITTADKTKYTVFSFTQAIPKQDKELQKALKKTNSKINNDYSYRFEIFEALDTPYTEGKPMDKVWVGYDKLQVIYADSITVLIRDKNGEWQATQFKD
ncbi:MAG: hypothetical protein ACRBHB_19405 [Arenicella sp.]